MEVNPFGLLGSIMQKRTCVPWSSIVHTAGERCSTLPLRNIHYPDIDAIVASDLAGEYPTIRYGPPDGSFTLDLLSRLGERFGYDDIEAATVELEGEPVRTATPRMLYVMKRDTLRPLDQADAAALRRTFNLEDE